MTRPRRAALTTVLAALSVMAIVYPAAEAIAATWFGPDGASYFDAVNWLPMNVPDTDTEAAQFSGGTGGVALNADTRIDVLNYRGGTHTFFSTGGVTHEIDANRVSVTEATSGGILTLANYTGTNPVDLVGRDEVLVGNEGVLNIFDGAEVDAGTLSLGAISTGDGRIVVDGIDSRLDSGLKGASVIGAQTSTGTLIVRNDGAARFFDVLDVAVDSVPGSGAVIDVLNEGVLLAFGAVNFGTGTGAGQSAVMTVDGAGGEFAAFQQSSTAALNIGGSTAGNTALIDVKNTGLFTTGTTTIHPTGEVRVNDSSFTANGDLVVDGFLDLQADATFLLVPGKDLTINAGGQVLTIADITIDGGVLTRNVGGMFTRLADQKLTGTNNATLNFFSTDLSILAGQTVEVNTGADLIANPQIGATTAGSLIADGFLSTVSGSTGAILIWRDGDATFRNDALGSLGHVFLAGSTSPGTTAELTVESDASVTLGDLNIATAGGATTRGTVRVNDSFTSLRLRDDSTLTVGHASQGTAEILIDDGGFTTGTGDITINPTGLIEVLGARGSFFANGDMLIDGGTLRTVVPLSQSGSFFLAGGKTLTAINDAQLTLGGFSIRDDSAWNIRSGSDLTAADLSVIVGSLSGGEMTVDGLDGTATTVIIEEGSLTVGSSFDASAGSGVVTIRDGGQVEANPTGVGSGVGVRVAESDIPLTSGTITIEDGGTLNTSGSIRVATAGGANTNGRINVTGGTLTQTGAAGVDVGESTVGFAAISVSRGGVFSTGTGAVDIEAGGVLSVNGGSDPGDTSGVFIANGPLTVRGQVFVPQQDGVATDPGGELIVNAGMTIDGGSALLFKGSVDADAIMLTNGGAFDFTGGTLTVGAFTGDLTNAGGQLSPGGDGGQDTYGITSVIGGYTQQAGSTLDVEIAGTASVAQHDLVSVTGVALLGGDLAIELFGFTPDPADTFTVLGASSLVGAFANVTPGQRLDTLDGSGSFQVNYGFGSAFASNELVLSDFILSVIVGDYDGSGQVEQGDLDVVLQNWGTGAFTGDEAALVGGGPFDGTVDQNELDGVLQNWGNTAAPDFAGFNAAQLPEPASVAVLLSFGAAGMRRSGCAG